MNRVDEIGQSLQEIVDRLSKHLDHFEQGESTWRLEQVELKFSLDLEAEAGVVIRGPRRLRALKPHSAGSPARRKRKEWWHRRR